VIENISLPEEVEKSIDKRTSMGVVGDLNKYSQYQAAEAMREAANNPSGGGFAGMGVGMGAGAAMGQMFSQSMNGAAAQPAAQAATVPCVACAKPIPVDSRFCPECGAAQTPVAQTCAGCGAELAAGAKFCPACGQKVG